MFRIESYVTPILLSYVDKYVRDFKPADAQVSLWGGGVVLHNLVLKADVLQEEVSLPFTLVSGRIHELLIQVPWTKIMSEPIVATIDTIECVLNLKPPSGTEDEQTEKPPPSTQVVEAPPGYMQALVRRIVSNIAVRVHHLIVKYVQDDIVMSLNVKHLSIDSACSNWLPTFADIDQTRPVLRRLVQLDDFTLCLDKADSDGKIRFYQEPLLYRCKLDVRVLTQLVSATTRRASSVSIDLRSTKLAWSVTSEQLTLLLRLIREQSLAHASPKSPVFYKAIPRTHPQTQISSSNSAEPARAGSWSEWAWSWLPSLSDRQGSPDDLPASPAPLPIYFNAFLDDISLAFKVMELDALNKKRARSVLECGASFAAVQSVTCNPTVMRVNFGARDIILRSHGKCVCGFLNFDAVHNDPTIYLNRKERVSESWQWPEDLLQSNLSSKTEIPTVEPSEAPAEVPAESEEVPSTSPNPDPEPDQWLLDDNDLWKWMDPVLFIDFSHERSPPTRNNDPYEDIPHDFEDSDWVEEYKVRIRLEPIKLNIAMGFVHRAKFLYSIFKEMEPIPVPERPMRVLTVEECDALREYVPERRICFEARGLQFQLKPWNHSLIERPLPVPLVFTTLFPKITVNVRIPMYPHRICSAACQMPNYVGPLWQSSRMNISAAIEQVKMYIATLDDQEQKPIARADINLVVNILLNKHYFTKHESVEISYLLKISEMSIFGSMARLQAAWQVPKSLIIDRLSIALRNTSLPNDALNDEESVAMDVTLEDLVVRGFLTKTINTHIATLQSIKATAFHEPSPGMVKQAWIFSGPDTPSASAYMRACVQWCSEVGPLTCDYLGFWTESSAMSIDPLLISWLAYKPVLTSRPAEHQNASLFGIRTLSTNRYFTQRKASSPSQSTSNTRQGYGGELVHIRTRPSLDSSSHDHTEKKVKKQVKEEWWHGDRLVALHNRLRLILMNVEVGLMVVYVTMSTANAIDCVTLRDALELHASRAHRVVALSLGRVFLSSNKVNKHLWQYIKHDGPTVLTQKLEEQSFPWKLCIADVSCYTLETSQVTKPNISVRSSTYTANAPDLGESSERATATASGLRSNIKDLRMHVYPRTVLELVTTSVIVSVVTKSVAVKHADSPRRAKTVSSKPTTAKPNYFETGKDFKPSTLKEFLRGPQRLSKGAEAKAVKDEDSPEKAPPPPPIVPVEPVPSGPLVSLGVNLHADTPPVKIRLESYQIHEIAAAIHCLQHIVTLLQRPPITLPGHKMRFAVRAPSRSSFPRTASDFDEQVSDKSSEILVIYNSDIHGLPVKTFFWCQWVISSASLVVSSNSVKLSFDADAIITTVDVQSHYNQFKIKIDSASVKHYERDNMDEWIPGVFGGRVLEAREAYNREEDHFLSITVTQALISNLPDSWKQELHPKLLEKKNDTMWEVYATLAPLEVIIQPVILDNFATLIDEIKPRAYCPLEEESQESIVIKYWPFCYVTAGGLRVLVTADNEKDAGDDTFVFQIGGISLNPHPANPICRRSASSAPDVSWTTHSADHEGRQYEVNIKDFAIHSVVLNQLIERESQQKQKKKSENPAYHWTNPPSEPNLTPLLQPLDICCVLAPTLFAGDTIVCGPAVEINFTNDCCLDINIEQIVVWLRIVSAIQTGLYDRPDAVDQEERHYCPYADFIKMALPDTIFSETLSETSLTNVSHESITGIAEDSGVDTMASLASSSKNKFTDDMALKHKESVDMRSYPDPTEHLEVFITMGVVDLCLYVEESPEVADLKPAVTTAEAVPTVTKEEFIARRTVQISPQTTGREKGLDAQSAASITETVRVFDRGLSEVNLNMAGLHKKKQGSIPILFVSLNQPNLYYWKSKGHRNLLLTLFDASLGLGTRTTHLWHLDLFTTAKGIPDPLTGIPPALATMKLVAPVSYNRSKLGTIDLDLERPFNIIICEHRMNRLIAIMHLVKKRFAVDPSSVRPSPSIPEPTTPIIDKPVPYQLRKALISHGIGSVTMKTSQIVVSGFDMSLAWDNMSCQLGASHRPERLCSRGVISALVLSVADAADLRHIVLQPMMLGLQVNAHWEAWRRAEGGAMRYHPTLHVSLELDKIIIDVYPKDLKIVSDLITVWKHLQEKMKLQEEDEEEEEEEFLGNSWSSDVTSNEMRTNSMRTNSMPTGSTVTRESTTPRERDRDSDTGGNHYYQDDLRSGAFKIVQGGQLPMAYQVMLHRNSVSWRYPHPRAVTRVVAFPLPGMDTEVNCVLEVYNSILDQWEYHTFFDIPVGEPRELSLYMPPPAAVFAKMWRFRACLPHEEEQRTSKPYEFTITKFLPRADPLATDQVPAEFKRRYSPVTAEQLSGVLRVDSYFSPRELPLVECMVQLGKMEVNLCNSLPEHSSVDTSLEGYYVSRPLMLCHRILNVVVMNMKMYTQLGAIAGNMAVVESTLSSNILACSTGTMEHLINNIQVRGGVVCNNMKEDDIRSRIFTTVLQMGLDVPRLRTLEALAKDWQLAYKKYFGVVEDKNLFCVNTVESPASTILEGRVALWVHNTCTSALRIGQENTDDVVPLGPGAILAYRWNSPTAPKTLRIALAGPTSNWKWSKSIPFTACSMRVKLEVPEESEKTRPMDLHVFVKVEETGSTRTMTLSGRLCLANMLRHNLLYKIRSRCLETNQWHTVSSDEMQSESIGSTVICNEEAEMTLKIKLSTHEAGWSGDIPLKQCPKENVPWLVKVPTDGEIAYMSVWCRVTRARNDGRILAAVWPLYVIRSHLPLDADVLISTEIAAKSEGSTTEVVEKKDVIPPIVQSTPGRGVSTHLQAPGTTADRHSLSFQYRDIETPVTREALPLHYGVMDTSVFDKRNPVMDIEDVISEILKWLEESASDKISAWPYSIVSKHYNGPQWQASLMQPRCDVTARYRAVHAGGGCCLEIQLCPRVLLCNASPIPLTLRAHDAAPMCKLESGSALSPSSAILTLPFFISVEIGRETFVSDQLEVTTIDPGRYGTLPPRHVALDHPMSIAIHCNQKVAMLTLYYEIKEDINIIGITSSFVLVNRLERNILASAVAVCARTVEETQYFRPKAYKVIPPSKSNCVHGTPLTRFWLRGRWRSGAELTDLNTFLYLTLTDTCMNVNTVPVRVGEPPVRRAISLTNQDGHSMPIIVNQIKHQSRWLIILMHDPCPQFIVHNKTDKAFFIGEPETKLIDLPSTSNVTQVVQECLNSYWYALVQPEASLHYSTPSYCAKFPPPPSSKASSVTTHPVPRIIFGKKLESTLKEWCAPVAVTDGEHLLQFYGGLTIKLIVQTHPHSTLLELRETDHNDLSASDIRRRLQGAVLWDSGTKLNRTQKTPEIDIGSDEGGASLKSKGESKSVLDVGSLPSHTSASTPPTRHSSKATVLSDQEESDKTKTLPLRKLKGAKSDVCSFAGHEHSLLVPWTDHEECCERVRFVMGGISIEMSSNCDTKPLFALHLDRTSVQLTSNYESSLTVIAIADIQIDNLQYVSGQYDFAVVASTRSEPLKPDRWPSVWNVFGETEAFDMRLEDASIMLKLTHGTWEVLDYKYRELTDLEVKVGSLSLYIEDAYVKAFVELVRLVLPASSANVTVAAVLAEEKSMQSPLRLRLLYVHPLDLMLTLHTAVRMYIALDQSPLRLAEFKLNDMMTSTDRLTHALTIHYLSAAILGAGWVVGGLELLGAPGALAARLGGATGGVKGLASATAAALLRSLSAWAGSLARNLDLLAGDEEHARRAAAARRQLPSSFVAGVMAGVTNFAINILGAVGGLAHHPLVGVAVGETESGAAALRRGLLGALTKPLSATADLVAYAGHGLLNQTGWDPIPKPRQLESFIKLRKRYGWRRDCVRWNFRLAELNVLSGFEVLADSTPLQLLITNKYMVIADPDSERIVEMIDFRSCTLGQNQGQIIELTVLQRRQQRPLEDEDEYQYNAAAMARVARFTGAENAPRHVSQSEVRVISLLPAPGNTQALYAALATMLHQNSDTHIPLLI